MVSKQIQSIYELLGDNESRYIFIHRLKYLLNGDIREIYKIIRYKMIMKSGEERYNNSNSLARVMLNESNIEESKTETIKGIKKLIQNNIDSNDIILLQELDKKYFNEPFLKPSQKEVFVDAGALDGKTILDFIEWCENKYIKVYSFEPDVNSYKICKETIKKMR